MLNLTGVLVNTFTQPAFEPKEAQDGEQKPQKPKLQILGDVVLKNGEIKKDLISVSVPSLDLYEGKEGTEVSIPVGVFAPQKGSVTYFGL